MRESTVALRSGRMIRRCMSTPITAPMAMQVIIAEYHGQFELSRRS